MTAVRVHITSSEYTAPTFGWYEIFADQTHLADVDVEADADISDIFFASSYLHANLASGETWHYWVRAVSDFGATEGPLAYLGSLTVPASPSGSSLTLKDEGSVLTAVAASIDFVGAGVVAAIASGDDVTVTIAGYTDEQAQDAAASLIQNGTGISWSYNDGANTLTPTITLAPFSTTSLAEGANLYYTAERVDDEVAVLIQNGTGITWSYNDGAGTLTPTVTITQYTDEMARDAIGAALVAGAGITITVNDPADTITIASSITQYTDEMVDDRVAALLVAGSGITLTYNDGANTLTVASSGSYTDEQAQDAIGTILTGLSYNDTTPSIAAIRVAQIQVTDPNGSPLTTGDGKAYFRVNSQLNGYNLSAVAAKVTTASSSGLPTVQIANETDAVDMLSTKLTIDSGETDSSTATTAAVIDATKDDVATADLLRIDVDVSGTGTKGLIVELTFQLP